MHPLGRDDFIRALRLEFPDVAEDIDPHIEGGLLHLEVAALCRAVETALDAADLAEVLRHFVFADGLLQNAGPELENALYVSYLEHLELDGHRVFAKELLPPKLHAAWLEINAHLDYLPGGMLAPS